MKTIPVILICYNRPWHTYEVLKALEQHNIQNLIIFSDAPKTEEDAANVLKTRSLFECIKWTKPDIILQEENQGLAKSIVSAINYVFEKSEHLILLEDDCVPQKYFFQFITECLKRYSTNEQVFGVSGYTVPMTSHILADYPFDHYFFPRIGSWGWATWKRAWKSYEPDLLKLYKEALKTNIDMAQGGSDIPVNVENMLSGELKDVWTLSWVLAVYLQNGYFVYPTKTHIDNIGMDGSGLHCGKTNKFVSPVATEEPKRFTNTIFIDQSISKHFRSFYDIPLPG